MNTFQIIDKGNNKIDIKILFGDVNEEIYLRNQEFSDPIEKKEKDTIRWYLDEYILFPYGAEVDKAKSIENNIKVYGAKLFKSIFMINKTDTNFMENYNKMREIGLSNYEFSVISDDPKFLNIPWEIMYDTKNNTFLILETKSFYRMISYERNFFDNSIEIRGGKVDILIVISRPYGKADIGYRSIVNAILDNTTINKNYYNIEILRPPTLNALEERLKSKKFDIIHFDCHGTFVKENSNQSTAYGSNFGDGYLILEDHNFKPDTVSGLNIGDIIGKYKLKLCIINACQSATEDDDLVFSSVSTQLLNKGVNNVVAMSGLAHENMVRIFIGELYLGILSNKSVEESFSLARMKIALNKNRESEIGIIELNDWIVPRMFKKNTDAVLFKYLEENLTENTECNNSIIDGEREYSFIGRDNEILEIERFLSRDEYSLLLIYGELGIGKSELAIEFTKWYNSTCNRRNFIYYVALEENIEIFTVIFGILKKNLDTCDTLDEYKVEDIVKIISEKEYIFIFDNFECINEYDTYENSIRNEKSTNYRFLEMLAGSNTKVILISTKLDNINLNVSYKTLNLKPFEDVDSFEFSKEVLYKCGLNIYNYLSDSEFFTLLNILNGHPKTMIRILPELSYKTVTEILMEIRGLNIEEKKIENDSLINKFQCLSEDVKELLMIIRYHCKNINSVLVQEFILFNYNNKGIGYEYFENCCSRHGINELLAEAEKKGFLLKRLESKESIFYYISPEVAMFLRNQQVCGRNSISCEKLERHYLNFYGTLSSAAILELINRQQDWYVYIMAEEENLITALYLSLKYEHWEYSQQLVQTIEKLYTYSDRIEEGTHLLNTVLEELSDKHNKMNEKLVVYLYSSLGEIYSISSKYSDLSKAEEYYEFALKYLSKEYEKKKKEIAVIFYQRGLIHSRKREFNEAREFVEKSLELRKEMNLIEDIAYCYFQLGSIYKENSEPDLAIGFYKKILDIHDQTNINIELVLGTLINYEYIEFLNENYDSAERLFWQAQLLANKYNLTMNNQVAIAYHGIAMIYDENEDYNRAEKLYKEVIRMLDGKEQQYKIQLLSTYHQLGMLYEKIKLYSDSKLWLLRSIKEKEELGLYYEAASSYHELGVTMTSCGDYIEAEKNLLKSLELYGLDEKSKAGVYFRLAVLRLSQNKLKECVPYLAKALDISCKFNDIIMKRDATKFIETIELIVGKALFRLEWEKVCSNLKINSNIYSKQL